jgi:hypothetical protein
VGFLALDRPERPAPLRYRAAPPLRKHKGLGMLDCWTSDESDSAADPAVCHAELRVGGEVREADLSFSEWFDFLISLKTQFPSAAMVRRDHPTDPIRIAEYAGGPTILTAWPILEGQPPRADRRTLN